MSILKLNGEYQSKYKNTVVTENGSYSESKFKSESEENSFHKFLKKEAKRVFNLKLTENKGKSFDEVKASVFNTHFPRWGQE